MNVQQAIADLNRIRAEATVSAVAYPGNAEYYRGRITGIDAALYYFVGAEAEERAARAAEVEA